MQFLRNLEQPVERQKRIKQPRKMRCVSQGGMKSNYRSADEIEVLMVMQSFTKVT